MMKRNTLYQRSVWYALKYDGIFINADLVKGETDKTEQKYHDMWMDWIHEAGLSQHELSEIIDRMQYDRPSSLTIQLQWAKGNRLSRCRLLLQIFQFCRVFRQKGSIIRDGQKDGKRLNKVTSMR